MSKAARLASPGASKSWKLDSGLGFRVWGLDCIIINQGLGGCHFGFEVLKI